MKYQPAGSRCLRPGCPHLARPHRRYPRLATLYCSLRCREATYRLREREEQMELAEKLRRLVGMPGGRGWQFTLPELRELARRVGALIPSRSCIVCGDEFRPARRLQETCSVRCWERARYRRAVGASISDAEFQPSLGRGKPRLRKVG